MASTLAGVFRAKDLRKRILFTLMILAVYRIGVIIPVPGVNATMLQSLASKSAVIGLLNTFSGGALNRFSIFTMNIYPYVTASIIVQLLSQGVIQRWDDWSKEGETGRAKLTQWTRFLTVALGVVQAVALTFSFSRQLGAGFIVDPSIWTYALIAITMTAGTVFMMWLGEQITDKGIGNGISVIILLSILSRVETVIPLLYANWFQAHPGQIFLNVLKVVILLAVVLLMTVFIVFVQQGVRRVAVQYAKRQVGSTVYGGQSAHIPIKVNAAGVIPVIFATSLLFLPAIIGGFFQGNPVGQWLVNFFSPTNWIFDALEFALIIGFTFFYTLVQMNPQQMAENLQKNAGSIPGIRPGKATEDYITQLLNRLSLIGGLFLAIVSILPLAFMSIGGMSQINSYYSGTSFLIVITVALDTMRQLEGQILQRSYRGFIR
ncbi:preprotein translocase subunit SecY [Ferroacidibacillus organovorans]|uniref:Protein translocase subunit SecY n=1 Tax=Ferroacidibacillus organovorans TaxID=1765683 RepID=A0A101XPE1_9BACL|nr:preprotein translocase subunit SecY [Ferroacidibacillus organovorans]KUO95162.1 preprotein translocase subunit SecY [Ferroacidibacillus organovorans]